MTKAVKSSSGITYAAGPQGVVNGGVRVDVQDAASLLQTAGHQMTLLVEAQRAVGKCVARLKDAVSSGDWDTARAELEGLPSHVEQLVVRAGNVKTWFVGVGDGKE